MKKQKLLVAFGSLLVLAFITITAQGQKFWEKKPYQQWSKEEALLLLTDSPWAQTESLDLDLTGSLKPSGIPMGTVRLRSALPIRQALVRLKQLKVKYDKLSITDKAKFDTEVNALLDCSLCLKFYVVSLEMKQSERKKQFEKLSAEQRSLHIFLVNDKNEQRNLAQLVIEGSEVFFFFPRLNEQGKPLLDSDIKAFQFFMNLKEIFKGKLPPLIPGRYTFEVSKLTQGGEILF